MGRICRLHKLAQFHVKPKKHKLKNLYLYFVYDDKCDAEAKIMTNMMMTNMMMMMTMISHQQGARQKGCRGMLPPVEVGQCAKNFQFSTFRGLENQLFRQTQAECMENIVFLACVLVMI